VKVQLAASAILAHGYGRWSPSLLAAFAQASRASGSGTQSPASHR